jgi:hypothetical protein
VQHDTEPAEGQVWRGRAGHHAQGHGGHREEEQGLRGREPQATDQEKDDAAEQRHEADLARAGTAGDHVYEITAGLARRQSRRGAPQKHGRRRKFFIVL